MIIDCFSVENTYLDFAKEGAKQFDELGPNIGCIYPRNDPAAGVYEDAIIAKSRGFIGVFSSPVNSEAEIIKQIKVWNTASSVHGILVISPPKDMVNPHSLIVDHKNVEGNDFDDRLDRVSCTARSIIAIIAHTLADGKPDKTEKLLEGKNVVIVGYGKAVGKPLSYLLMRYHVGSVTTIHKYTQPEISRRDLEQADIIVSATGIRSLLSRIMLKNEISFGKILLKDKIIIDAGITKIGDKIMGDVPPAFVENNQVTPVPGGVGAVTTAMILANTTWAARGLLT